MRQNMDPKQAVIIPEYNVQSVCLGDNRIVVGMRTGTIKEVIISKETVNINANFKDKKKDKTWIKNIDSE